MNTKEKIQTCLNHLHWFYNADMTEIENKEDYLATLDKLNSLVATL